MDAAEMLAILGGAMGVTSFGIALGLRHAGRQRGMEHLERMKALEMGLLPQPAGLDWPAATVCTALGAGVPVGTFLVTWLAALTADVPGGIWAAPVLVSFSAIHSARKLACRSTAPRPGANKTAPVKPSKPTAKQPNFDPDAYDVVGSRG